VSIATRALPRWGLGCGFFQPALPLSPSRLRPLGQQGRKADSPASTRNSVVSVHNIARQVLDYSTRGVYLLRRSLSDLQLLGDVLACHVARPPRWRRQTSLQASRRIVDEGDIGQSRAVLTVQNRTQVHRKPTGDLVPFSPRRVLPRFVNPRIGSKLLGFSI
jgi:hypothetical protein